MVGTGEKNEYTAGQRIHLVGRVCSQNYWSDEGKLQQKILLKCGEFQRLSNNDQQADLNRVRLYAQISSDIHNRSDHSSFMLTTKHTPKLVCPEIICIRIEFYSNCQLFIYFRGGVAAGIFATDYHKILVRDPAMLDLVRKSLKIGDWVDVNGKIDYKFMQNSKEKLRQSGFILANSLSKVNEVDGG